MAVHRDLTFPDGGRLLRVVDEKDGVTLDQRR
jgi:hypothetical protein